MNKGLLYSRILPPNRSPTLSHPELALRWKRQHKLDFLSIYPFWWCMHALLLPLLLIFLFIVLYYTSIPFVIISHPEWYGTMSGTKFAITRCTVHSTCLFLYMHALHLSLVSSHS